MQCPICHTINESSAAHCSTCAWYFPLRETPHYGIELSRAKQQYQMVSAFNQVYQHMQVQSKVLEKMSFRLDGLESVVSQLKSSSGVGHLNLEEETYPELKPIKRAEDFDTPEKRAVWWEGLEEQWQHAFNQGLLGKEKVADAPDDETLKGIFESPTLRFVGPRGMYGNIDFELTNLSGVKHLTNLTILVISHNALTDIKGCEYLTNLVGFFINSNKITSIKEVYYLPQLEDLYCNVNQITTLEPITKLTNLKTLYCSYNRLTNLVGITAGHSEKLKKITVYPNEGILPNEIKRIEDLGIFCKKG